MAKHKDETILSPTERLFVKAARSPNYKAEIPVWLGVVDVIKGALTEQCIADAILRARIAERKLTTLAALREKQSLYALFGLPFSKEDRDALWRLENPEAARMRDGISQITRALRTYEAMVTGLPYSRAGGYHPDNLILEKWGILTKQSGRWIIRPNADASALRARLTKLNERFHELVGRSHVVSVS
jgi:hypothetical protein